MDGPIRRLQGCSSGLVEGAKQWIVTPSSGLAREAGLHLPQPMLLGCPSLEASSADASPPCIAAHEREQCAKVVENYTGAWNGEAGYALAAAIQEQEMNENLILAAALKVWTDVGTPHTEVV
jgi:hypothetical protein